MKAHEIIKGLGLPGFQVLQAWMAGPNTGPTRASCRPRAAWQTRVDEQQASGLADVVSNSVWVDVTP